MHPTPSPARRTARWTEGGVDETVVRRLSQRLESELGTLLGWVPPEHRTVTGLSTWAGVARPLCHRVMAAGRPRGEPLEIIDQLPGVRGLEKTVTAIAGRVGTREAKTAAAQAARCYRELIGHLGGSQAKARLGVVAILTGSTGRAEGVGGAAGAADGGPTGTRRASHRAAVGVARAGSSAMLVLQAVWPDGGSGTIEASMAVGHVGLRLGPGHLPVLCTWEKRNRVDDRSTSQGDERRRGLNPAALLDRFSSDPFPRVITRSEGGVDTDVLDFDPAHLAGGGDDRGLDFFVASRIRGTLEPGGFEFHSVPRIPTRRLVLDLLLHKDLPLGGKASGSAYFVGMSGLVRGDGAARWFDRMGGVPDPLDVADAAAAVGRITPVYARYRELLDHVLNEAGLGLENMRWVRWDVPWPLWGCDHALRVARTD